MSKLFIITIFSFITLYAVFHIGRWYEFKHVQDNVYEAFEYSKPVGEKVVFDYRGVDMLLTYYPEL